MSGELSSGGKGAGPQDSDEQVGQNLLLQSEHRRNREEMKNCVMDGPLQTVQMCVAANGLLSLEAGAKAESICQGEMKS